jgi:hypothetical protein
MTLPQLFQKAGLKFDFSSQYVSELMSFVHNEMKEL